METINACEDKRVIEQNRSSPICGVAFYGVVPDSVYDGEDIFPWSVTGGWAYSIAGQLSWINLIYEVMNEAVILTLYFFMASVLADKKAFANRVRSGLVVSFGVYAACSIPVAVFINPILLFMAGVWQPTLVGIALMFGGGNAFDSVVSYLVYRHFFLRSAG